MISSLITSQTRIRLLKKFFLNSSTRAHLRGLESEFGESSNAIRIELNRLEGAGLLKSSREGNKKVFSANRLHPLFNEIHNIILKETGIDRVVEKVIGKLGNLLSVYLTGDFAMGRDSQVIDLVLVGDHIDREYLARKVAQAESVVQRKVRYMILEPSEEPALLESLSPAQILPLWSKASAGHDVHKAGNRRKVRKRR